MSRQVKKDIRLPEELTRWIEALPPKYGHNFAQKVRYLLELAKERQEKLDFIIAEHDVDYNGKDQKKSS